MSKLTINMHTSQRTIALLPESRWTGGDIEDVTTGYAPAEVEVKLMTGASEPVAHYQWFAVDPGNIYRQDDGAVADTFVTVHERGFYINKDAAEALHDTAEIKMALVRAVGCKYSSSGANAAATSGDTAMDPIVPSTDNGYGHDEY